MCVKNCCNAHPLPQILHQHITTQYNLIYTHCNSCLPFMLTNKILIHSPQLAVMMFVSITTVT